MTVSTLISCRVPKAVDVKPADPDELLRGQLSKRAIPGQTLSLSLLIRFSDAQFQSDLKRDSAVGIWDANTPTVKHCVCRKFPCNNSHNMHSFERFFLFSPSFVAFGIFQGINKSKNDCTGQIKNLRWGKKKIKSVHHLCSRACVKIHSQDLKTVSLIPQDKSSWWKKKVTQERSLQCLSDA